MRNTFIKTLVEEAEKNPAIFLLCGDLGYSVLEQFADRFPDRFMNVGIAEQNMMGIATGLSMEGYNVFTYSIGNFPTLRCMEQIRYDICYHHANVKVIAVGGGYAYGPLGVSHHTTEEIGMLRSIPDLQVTSPGDPQEVVGLARYLANYTGPAYLRLNKTGEPKLYETPPVFTAPKAIQLLKQPSAKIAICATGDILNYAHQYVKANNINADVYSFPFVSPIDTDMITQIANQYAQIHVIEEHQLNCGFTSAFVEAANDLYAQSRLTQFPKIHRIAIPNQFIGYAGTQEFLRQQAGLMLSL
jgi:transketolase